MNMIRLKTGLAFHFMNCRIMLEIVLKIFGQPTSAVWISLRKAQGKLNTKGSIEQPSGIFFSKLSCQMTLGVSVTLGVSISFVTIQRYNILKSFSLYNHTSKWSLSFPGFKVQDPADQVILPWPSIMASKIDYTPSSIYIKQTVCTYVPLSRPNRPTNIHQILHRPPHQPRDGS